MDDFLFLEKLFDINQPMTNDPVRFSTISMLLRNARNLTGRNLISGLYEQGELNENNFENQSYHSNLFTGLISYLIILEQIGSILKSKEKSNKIQLALTGSTLSKEQSEAIRAFRNSLIHNYGLATERNAYPMKHKYTISIERNPIIVKLPAIKWSGDFSDKSEKTSTTIYLHDLLDLIEGIYLETRLSILNKDIEFPEIAIDELKTRYTIVF